MAVVFLCGGTGNQLFQFAASCPQDRFSSLFLDGPLPRLLGWSQHGRLLEFAAPARWRELAVLALLLVDLVVARVTARSLFTRLDLRTVKAEPVFARLGQLGYFQACAPIRDVAPLGQQLLALRPAGQTDQVDIALHLRGGDVLRLQAEGRNPYGLLPTEYFAAALDRHQEPGQRLTIFTDDRDHAAALLRHLAPRCPATIDDGPLDGMLAGCIAAHTFIACNSTLSWWIVRLRGAGRPSVVPTPFTKSLPLENPDYVDAICVQY